MTDTTKTAEDMMREWAVDPVAFVRDNFGAEPDEWQVDALRAVAKSPKVAMSACKGPGKSCLLAWVIWWFISTNVDAQVIAVSITADNLKDNLWKELAFWQSKSDVLKAAFDFGAERVKSREKPLTWWVSARAFAQGADPTQQANTLAGFHGENVMIVLDEVGDYPPGVLPAAEAIFANEVNAKLVVAGNPTNVGGPLYAIVKSPSGWEVITITGDPEDPKRSPRISLSWAQGEIDKWGRDHPWVKVNILGQFPPAGADQLIPLDIVEAAMRRAAPALHHSSSPRIWGLDPARFGDDAIVLAQRQGTVVTGMHEWRNLNGTQLGDIVAKMIREAEDKGEGPDAVFVDVGGVGASCYDRLVFLGYGDIVKPTDFGGAPGDPTRYLNKRSEIWCLAGDWLKDMPASLLHHPQLKADLIAPRFSFRVINKRTCLRLETKEEMRKRGVPSPNHGDALCLTFSAPVSPRSRESREAEYGQQTHAKTEYQLFGGA